MMLNHGDLIIFGKDPTKYTFLYPLGKTGALPPEGLNYGKSNELGTDRQSVHTAEFGNREQSIGTLSPFHNQRPQRTFYDTPPVSENYLQNKNSSNLKENGQAAFEQSDKQIEILRLRTLLAEIEEKLLQRESELKLAQNEISSLKDDNQGLKSKLKAIELYASELQKLNDTVQQDLADKNALLVDFQSSDIAKRATNYEVELNSLRKLLVMRDDEVSSLKKQLQAVLQEQRDGSVNANHLQHFLEQQAQELLNAKKQLLEHESRDEKCKRKWQTLVKENMAKEEQIKGLSLQLNRQVENYQQLFDEQDRKLNAAHAKFLELVSQDPWTQERQAAAFLVDQMQAIQEDRAKVAIENEQLHLKVQEFIDEIRHLNAELDFFQRYVEDSSSAFGTQAPFGKLKKKIEELEDLVYELKQKENVMKIVDLTEALGSLERKVAQQADTIADLKHKLSNKSQGVRTNSERSTVDFFSKIIEEKDKQITSLEKQCELMTSKEKQYYFEIERLKANVKDLTFQLEGQGNRFGHGQDLRHKKVTFGDD